MGGFGLFVGILDPCVGHLHFLSGMNLQFSAITMRMHVFTFYMSIYAYHGVRSVSIGVDFVLVVVPGLHQRPARYVQFHNTHICRRQSYVSYHRI